MDTKDIIDQLNAKNEAIIELIKVMDKYNLTFTAEVLYSDNGNTGVKFSIEGDFYEDGSPLDYFVKSEEGDLEVSAQDFALN